MKVLCRVTMVAMVDFENHHASRLAAQSHPAFTLAEDGGRSKKGGGAVSLIEIEWRNGGSCFKNIILFKEGTAERSSSARKHAQLQQQKKR